ncbi:MAG: hypothetical protein L0323_23120, partial [Planctomycetes bacterium]|nr:hypothetical protein [Planctomycetota bacterium]
PLPGRIDWPAPKAFGDPTPEGGPVSRRAPRLALGSVLALAASACHETEATVELSDKGAATLGMNVKFTKAFVTPATALARAVPGAPSILEEADPLFLKNPDPDLRKELEKEGLKILLLDSKNSDTELSSSFKVELQRLSALRQLARIRGGDGNAEEVPAGSGYRLPLDAVRLSRDKEGIYTLEVAFPVRVGGRILYPPDADGGAGSPKALAAQTLNSLLDGRATVTVTVPGPVVDFSPSGIGNTQAPKGAPKAPPRTVVFRLNKTTVPRTGLQMTDRKGDYLPVALKVRFRTPGRSLPADALWDGKPSPSEAPRDGPAPGPEDPPKQERRESESGFPSRLR